MNIHYIYINIIYRELWQKHADGKHWIFKISHIVIKPITNEFLWFTDGY